MTIPNRSHSPVVRGLAVVAIAALSACSGGGDDNMPAGAGGSSQGGTASANTSLNSFQNDLLQRVNAARTQGTQCGGNLMPAVGATQWNSALESAALAHSEYMRDTNSFSHTGQGGSSVGDRVTATGYQWSAVGENIAAGYPDSAAVMQGWLSSVGHCRNIMSASFSQVAVALVAGNAGSTNSTYWTMVLANPR